MSAIDRETAMCNTSEFLQDWHKFRAQTGKDIHADTPLSGIAHILKSTYGVSPFFADEMARYAEGQKRTRERVECMRARAMEMLQAEQPEGRAASASHIAEIERLARLLENQMGVIPVSQSAPGGGSGASMAGTFAMTFQPTSAEKSIFGTGGVAAAMDEVLRAQRYVTTDMLPKSPSIGDTVTIGPRRPPIGLHVEAHNPEPVDPAKAMDAVRAMCGGGS